MSSSYGQFPTPIAMDLEIDVKEMMYYQYMPIKIAGKYGVHFEERINVFDNIIGLCRDNYIKTFCNGKNLWLDTYMYLTVKNMYVSRSKPFNRLGYHSDGFGTNDVNYIWCNSNPTTFNSTCFNLSNDDQLSLKEMEAQALPENDYQYPINTLLRLDQYNIHKVSEIKKEGIRCFVKVSFSKDKYNLLGNTHNHLLNYNWEMVERKKERNVPQNNQQSK